MTKSTILVCMFLSGVAFSTSRTIRTSRQSSPSQTLWFNVDQPDNTGGFSQNNQNSVTNFRTEQNRAPTYNNNYGTKPAVVQPFYPVQPKPTYVQPKPTYVQPKPTYVQPKPTYVQPKPTYVQPKPTYQGTNTYGVQTGSNNYGGDGFSLDDLFGLE